MIYLDNAATTAVCEEAKAAAIEGFEAFGNPSSLHHLGVVAEGMMNSARSTVAGALGVKEKEIYFTSCATESSNTVIFGAAKAGGKRRKRIVTTTVEHPSVAGPISELEEQGFEVVRVSPDENGVITAKSILSQVNRNTLLVSVMHVNNETGYILPVKEIFKNVKRISPEILTHCDCVQSFMKLPFRAKDIGADCLSISGHKLHAPKGVGVLYLRGGINLKPLLYGGGQESGLRSGTENVSLINSLGAAVKRLEPTVMQRYETVSSLKAHLVKALSGREGIRINSGDDCSPYVISLSIERIKSETMLHFLESKGIYVSSGSACSRGKKSGVLSEFKIPDKYLDSTIRVSLCAENTEAELDELVSALLEGQGSLAKMR